MAMIALAMMSTTSAAWHQIQNGFTPVSLRRRQPPGQWP
jgi:hypothetical protein